MACMIHFLFSIKSARTRMQVTAGISNRMVSCTPKKKNSISSSPVHRFSYAVSEPARAMCRSHMHRQPAPVSGTIQSSHARAMVIRLSVPLNTVTMTASRRCLLVCSSALMPAQTPG